MRGAALAPSALPSPFPREFPTHGKVTEVRPPLRGLVPYLQINL